MTGGGIVPELIIDKWDNTQKDYICDFTYYEKYEDTEIGELYRAEIGLYGYGGLYANEQAIDDLVDISIEEFYRICDPLCKMYTLKGKKIRKTYFWIFKRFLRLICYRFEGKLLNSIRISEFDTAKLRKEMGKTLPVRYYGDDAEYSTEYDCMFEVYLTLLSTYIYAGFLVYRDTKCYTAWGDENDCTHTIKMYHRGRVSTLYISNYDYLPSIKDAQKYLVFANMPYSGTITNVIENRF